MRNTVISSHGAAMAPYSPMHTAPTSMPTPPARNGPTRCTNRPPYGAMNTIGSTNNVMPVFAIHVGAPRSFIINAHSESNTPIMKNTAMPMSTPAAIARSRSKSTAKRSVGVVLSGHLGDVQREDHERDQRQCCTNHDERSRDAEGLDEDGRDDRAGREPADFTREHPTEVSPEMIAVAHDDDATHRWQGTTKTDAREEPRPEKFR